jgi:hypothetical protein
MGLHLKETHNLPRHKVLRGQEGGIAVELR